MTLKHIITAGFCLLLPAACAIAQSRDTGTLRKPHRGRTDTVVRRSTTRHTVQTNTRKTNTPAGTRTHTYHKRTTRTRDTAVLR